MQFFLRLILCLIATGCFSVPSAFSQSGVSKPSDDKVASHQGSTGSPTRSLNESVGLALRSHPRIKAELSLFGARVAESQETESAYYPQVSLSLGLGREDSNNTSSRSLTGFGSEELERREASISLRQMLFDGFETHWRRERDTKETQAQHLALLEQADRLAFDAIRVHLDVMRLNRVLEDHIANLKTHERIAKDVGMRARLGKDDRAKVSQISARLSLSLANVEAAKGKLRIANADYQRVVGHRPSHALAFKVGLLAMPESLDVFWAEVEQFNPQLLSESMLLSAAKAERKLAGSSDLPSLYLESGASWNANLDGVRGRNSDAYVMLRMNYDLFSGGRASAGKKRARYLSEQVRYEYEDTRRDLRLRVDQAWHAYQSLSRRSSLLQDYVESAQNTKSAYIKQFNIGQRSLIDLLDAENELLNAKRLRSDARNELFMVKFQILQLQGGLLDKISVNVPFDRNLPHYQESVF